MAKISMVEENPYIKMASWQELQQLLKLVERNEELMEYLSSSLQYLLYYSRKYNIPLPNYEKIDDIVNKTTVLFDKSKISKIMSPTESQQPTENQQRNKTPDDETEPKILLITGKLGTSFIVIFKSFRWLIQWSFLMVDGLVY